jgi:hypothetical protein
MPNFEFRNAIRAGDSARSIIFVLVIVIVSSRETAGGRKTPNAERLTPNA